MTAAPSKNSLHSVIALLQRVSKAAVVVSDDTIADIGPGLLAFIGIEKNDSESTAAALLNRILHYRMFADEAGKMNLDLLTTAGDLLMVPQFTLAANTKNGRRPGFEPAAAPQLAKERFEHLQTLTRERYPTAQFGVFGADMAVSLINQGPVTFWLQEACPA